MPRRYVYDVVGLYKKVITAGTGALLAASLGGCVAVQLNPNDTVQEDLIGAVKLKFRLCANDTNGDPHTGCTDPTNEGDAPNSPETAQALVAVRVPAGTTAPDSFTGQSNLASPGPEQVTFTRSASYTAELQRLVSPGTDRAWIGYMSEVYDYAPDPAPATAARAISVDALPLGLPKAADGTPFASPFRYRVVAGGRKVDVTHPADRTVACGTDAFDGDDQTICIDSGLTAATIESFHAEPVTDLGIVAGTATLSPGQKVDLPFDARLNSGPLLPANTTFTLTAATAIPGVTPAPSIPGFTPLPGTSTRIKVPIAIPKNAGPGAFPVTVTAKLPNGQSRTGTGIVTVRDRQKPVVTKAKIRPTRFKPSKRKRRGANLSYTLSEAGTIKGSFLRCTRKRRGKCVKFKTLKGSFSRKAVKGTNTVHLTGYLRRKRLAAGTYRLAIASADLAGNRGKVVRAGFIIKR